MTAIHDLKYNACFLTNYDPEWSLGDEDKKKLTKSLVRLCICTHSLKLCDELLETNITNIVLPIV